MAPRLPFHPFQPTLNNFKTTLQQSHVADAKNPHDAQVQAPIASCCHMSLEGSPRKCYSDHEDYTKKVMAITLGVHRFSSII